MNAASRRAEPPDAPAALPVAAPSPLRALALAAGIAACVVGVRAFSLATTGGPLHDALRRAADAPGARGPALFALVSAAAIAIGVPRVPLAALGGLLFGWWRGAVLAQAATMVACWLTFTGARALGGGAIESGVHGRLPRAEALLDLIGRHGFVANVLLRVLPVGNCFATNLLLAVSPVRLPVFLLGTLAGTLPETLVYALFGSAAEQRTGLRLAVATALLVVLTALSALWLRRAHLAREVAGAGARSAETRA